MTVSKLIKRCIMISRIMIVNSDNANKYYIKEKGDIERIPDYLLSCKIWKITINDGILVVIV